MIFQWGSYQHQPNECGLKIRNRQVFDKFGRVMASIVEYHVIGAIIGTSQADITSKLSSLESAYINSGFKDIKLLEDDASTETQHTLLNSETFGGTHCVHFDYPEGPWKMGPEYANRRTYYIVLRGEKRYGNGLYAWTERLSIRGTGAPKWRYMPSMTGAPVRQDLQQQTPFYYVQQGMAIGRYARPAPPTPIFPTIEHGDMREVSFVTPEEIRVNGADKYAVTWRYVMEATNAQGFSGLIWPTV